MKMMICASLDVGRLSAIDVSPDEMGLLQRGKIETLAGALDDAIKRGADACVAAGLSL